MKTNAERIEVQLADLVRVKKMPALRDSRWKCKVARLRRLVRNRRRARQERIERAKREGVLFVIRLGWRRDDEARP